MIENALSPWKIEEEDQVQIEPAPSVKSKQKDLPLPTPPATQKIPEDPYIPIDDEVRVRADPVI